MEKPKTEKPAEHQASPDTHQKKEKRKNEDKKIKHERPAQFQRNADLITEDTVLEPLPKKSEYLQRPVLKDYQDKESINKEKISNLIKKKKQIFDEKFKPTRALVKGEGGVHQDFQIQIEEFNHLKQRFVESKNQRNQKRDLLNNLIEEAKANNADLKKFREASKNSREYFEQQLEKYQHKLITQQLTKQQEKQLNNDIILMRRKMKDAESAGNIEVKIAKAEQRKQQLDSQIEKLKEEKEPLQKECKQLKEQMDAKNEHINKLKGEIKNENAQKTEAKQKNDKEYEDWKQNKKKRVDDTNKKIKQLDEANKKIWEEYHLKNQAYWEQKHKLDFLEWQHRVKQRKIRDKQRDKRRQAAIQKQKQREKEQQLKKYIKQIQLCNFLINYLKDVTDSNKEKVKQEQKTEQTKDINSKLGQDSQWKKEKGLIVLQSKKSKQDQEPVKKGKKPKKKNQKGEQTAQKKFEVPFNIELLFEQLKLLAPRSFEEVDGKIKQLKEREALFERACSQEVNESDKTQIEKIKGDGKKDKKDKAKQEQNKQEEFPTL